MEDFPLFEYWAILKRRQKTFFITALTVLIITLIIAARWSNYKAVATVEIEQSEIAAEITETGGMRTNSAMEAMADLRISRILQKVTSTATLVDIITKFNLYPKMRKNTPITEVTKVMRKKIKLDLVSSKLANPASAQKATAGQLAAIAFNLSFEYSTPLLSQQVTNELVSRFLDEDLKQRRLQTEETSTFLEKQINVLEKSMEEQEKKIAEYRSESGDARPETLMFNQQAAATVMMTLQTVDTQLATTKGNIGALRAQLISADPYTRAYADGQILTSPAMQLKALQTQFATLTAQYGPEHPDVLKAKRQLRSLKKQVKLPVDTSMLQSKIDDIKTKIATSKDTMGPENPEMKSLVRQLRKLKKQIEIAKKEKASTDSLIKYDADNPTYLSLVAQLREAEGTQKGLLAKRESLLKQQEKYQKALLSNPFAEQKLASLTRDYDNAQLRYRELRAKKMAADMTVQMEKERKGQRLQVINPPELPLQTKPSRKIILLGGIVFSVITGLASVIFAQILSQSVYGPNHLTSLVGVPPLTSIPYISTHAERQRKDRQKQYVVGLIAILLIMVAIYVSFKVMPLDVIWNVMTDRVGLS